MTMMQPIPRTGGKILVDQLLIHGVDTAFCVPGESYLDVLNALHDARDQINLVNARHEAGAANMAEAYGKMTGKPGIWHGHTRSRRVPCCHRSAYCAAGLHPDDPSGWTGGPPRS